MRTAAAARIARGRRAPERNAGRDIDDRFVSPLRGTQIPSARGREG
jgi:hypothetical protein